MGHLSSSPLDVCCRLLCAVRCALRADVCCVLGLVGVSACALHGLQDMTIRLCQQLLPPEKAEQTVAKLQRKQAKDWPKVRAACCRDRGTGERDPH